MRELGMEPGAATLSKAYAGIVDAVLCDHADPAAGSVITGIRFVAADTLMWSDGDQQRLARDVLALAAALCDPALPLLALSADLPLLTATDLESLVSALDHADVVIATDRAGIGTNALLQGNPELIAFSFGENSRTLHCQAARGSALVIAEIVREGLAGDIDLPADLALLEAKWSGQRT